MTKLIKRLIVSGFVVMLFSSPILSQENKLQSNSDSLTSALAAHLAERIGRLHDYSQEFIQFWNLNVSVNNFSEYEIVNHFERVATETGAQIGAIRSLIIIYGFVVAGSNKTAAKRFIEAEVHKYVKLIDINEGSLKALLSQTENEKLTTSGTRLKGELKEVRALLQSIDLPL